MQVTAKRSRTMRGVLFLLNCMCCVYAPYVLHNNLQNPFDAIDTSATMLDQIALVLNQHTLVLDYLTAAQGGMCR